MKSVASAIHCDGIVSVHKYNSVLSTLTGLFPDWFPVVAAALTLLL